MQGEYRIVPSSTGGLTLNFIEVHDDGRETHFATFNGVQSVPPFAVNDEFVMNQGTYRYVLKRWNINEDTGLVTEVEVLITRIRKPTYDMR